MRYLNLLVFCATFMASSVLQGVQFPYLQAYDREHPVKEFTIDMEQYQPGITEEEFKAKLIDYGFVVLLNAISAEKIDEMHAAVLATYQKAEEDETLDENEKNHVKNTHITEKVFNKYNNGKSLFDVFDERLHSFGKHFFSGNFHINERTFTRRVRPPKVNAQSCQLPIKIHIDAMYHGAEEFVLNFWTPLEDCGKDKPTLFNFLAGFQETFSLMEFDKEHFRFNPEIVASVEKGEAPFLQDLPCYYFVLNKGDLVVISNWTLHGGYADEGMNRPRLSMELRISNNTFWYE